MKSGVVPECHSDAVAKILCQSIYLTDALEWMSLQYGVDHSCCGGRLDAAWEDIICLFADVCFRFNCMRDRWDRER